MDRYESPIIFINRHKLSWIVMNCHELSGIVMNCHELSWIIMNCNELWWIIMNQHESSWIFIDNWWYIVLIFMNICDCISFRLLQMFCRIPICLSSLEITCCHKITAFSATAVCVTSIWHFPAFWTINNIGSTIILWWSLFERKIFFVWSF